MWKHIKDKYMTSKMRSNLSKDPDYYKREYDNVRFIRAVLEADNEEIMNCLLMGSADINFRVRMDPTRRDINDSTALGISISQYHLKLASLLLDMGADPEGVTVLFSGDDKFTANAVNLEASIKFCQDRNIKYRIGTVVDIVEDVDENGEE